MRQANGLRLAIFLFAMCLGSLPAFAQSYPAKPVRMVLALGGAVFLGYAPLIAGLVVLVFFVVVASYRQNVHAYPSGGGDYEVVTTNLGPKWGVFVASALLIDYVMTVYKELGAEKGASIQGVLSEMGLQNVNELRPTEYDAFYAKVEALK